LENQSTQTVYGRGANPLLVVISGTSGSGKDSVVKALIDRLLARQRPVHFVVTTTSRSMRENEVNGVDYCFVSPSEFEEMIANDELIEHALVYGDYKGVPKRQIHKAVEAMNQGADVVMRLDVQGAKTIRHMVPEALLIFMTTSSEQELVERLRRRSTENPEQLQIRLQTAREEMQQIAAFDYVVPNLDGKLDETVDTVLAIMTAEKYRTHPRRVEL
jgi:guanylate kinase